MTLRSTIPTALALAVGLCGDVHAQNEDALRQAFEGVVVCVRLDMPATHQGVDLRFDRDDPFDEREYFDRLRKRGVSIREGDCVPVTRVEVEDDRVEFQLAGGGFNWFWDSRTATTRRRGPSSHERELERRISKENDPGRRRRLERELKRLRRDREREDDHRRREEREAVDRDNVNRSLRDGSRFNLRFHDRVPAQALTPPGIERLLAPWVDFDLEVRGRDPGDWREDDDRP